MHQFLAPLPHHGRVYFYKLACGFVVGVVILALLQVLPARWRKPIIVIGTFLGGLYYVAEFFWPTHSLADGSTGNFLTPYQTFVGNLAQVIGSFAIGLGVVSLIGLHMRTVARFRRDWGFSAVLVIAFVAMTVFGILDAYYPHSRVFPAIGSFAAPTTSGDVYNVLFNGGLVNLDSAMFALIGFYIISASYRAFRIRSVEASLLMISALIVMLGQVTLGTAITNKLPLTGTWANFRMENMAAYILVQINSPAIRAVTFGLAVGLLAASLRLWLSLERGAYFDQEA